MINLFHLDDRFYQLYILSLCLSFKRQSGDDEVELPVLEHVDEDATLTKPTTCDNLPQLNLMVFLMFHCKTHKMRISFLATSSTD